VVRPTWRRHRRHPDDVVLALDPGMAFGPVCIPRPACVFASIESLADRRIDRESLACSTSVVVRGSSPSPPSDCARRTCSASTPTQSPWSDASERARNRVATPSGSVTARSEREPPFDVVLANLIAGLLVELASQLRAELRPGGTLLASGIFGRSRGGRPRGIEAAGLDINGRAVEGTGWRSTRFAGPDVVHPTIARWRPSFPRLLGTHIVLAVSLFLPSILLPFALRTRRATVESATGWCAPCSGPRRTERSSWASAWP